MRTTFRTSGKNLSELWTQTEQRKTCKSQYEHGSTTECRQQSAIGKRIRGSLPRQHAQHKSQHKGRTRQENTQQETLQRGS